MFKIIDKLFLEHPRKKNVSYIYHLYVSLSLSTSFIVAGSQAFIHAICPYYFETSSSDWLIILNDFMEKSHNKEKIN